MVKEESLKESDVNFTFLSKDKRFENLTGIVFGNLTILGPYKKEGSTLKWVAKCSCGNIVKTSRTKLKQRGKTSCVECSESKLRANHFTPVEDKINTLKDKRQDLVILNFKGDTWADYLEVECNVCGDIFERRYRDLVRGVKGCSCRNKARKGIEAKQELVKEYCDKNNFTFLSWDTTKGIKVKIRCDKHDYTTTTLYGGISVGKVCCPECVKETKVIYNKHTKESFIERAELVHGKGKFDYSEVEYTCTDTKVKIKCNSCGKVNLQKPAGHLSGRGCKICSKSGYKPEDPCWVYLMRLEGLCEEYYKIGITNDLKRRLYNVGCNSWYDIEYVYFRKLDKGWKAKRIEGLILSILNTKGCISKKYHKEGVTEIFHPDELPKVERYLEELILEEYYL
ncbi:endonuclease [Vibrio phage 11895-B1]|uniref:endonuclease n=1 Tax=Vibrio phage 11895-B1 TaxID=754075 RepID=UPI0002C0B823|nr:endonuclease [Vibrio phage 11895-B1]AGH32216.1 hypothetical protein VPHG_00152 [Vibrio phage 11895-B1]